MIARAKVYIAIGAALVLALGYAGLRIDARAYDRGVRDQKIKTQSATAVLNYRLREARDEARDAETDAESQRRALTELERELADERAERSSGWWPVHFS